jgi:hypothetical protein
MGLMQINGEGIPQNYLEGVKNVSLGMKVEKDQTNPFFDKDLKICFEERMRNDGKKERDFQEFVSKTTIEYFYGNQIQEQTQEDYIRYLQNLTGSDYSQFIEQIQNQEDNNNTQLIQTNEENSQIDLLENIIDENECSNLNEEIEIQEEIHECLNFS